MLPEKIPFDRLRTGGKRMIAFVVRLSNRKPIGLASASLAEVRSQPEFRRKGPPEVVLDRLAGQEGLIVLPQAPGID